MKGQMISIISERMSLKEEQNSKWHLLSLQQPLAKLSLGALRNIWVRSSLCSTDGVIVFDAGSRAHATLNF